MIIIKNKAFTVIEFLIASTLTVAVVASSTIGIGLAEKIQRDTYYSDTMNQVGNSLVQGSRALNCGVLFTSAAQLSCKAVFSNNGDVEINTAAPIPPSGTSPTDGILFPFTDGTYKYTVSSNFHLNIKISTTWLEAGSTDSCVHTGFTITEYPQPNMILRRISITSIEGNRTVKSKTFTDLQTVSSSIQSILGSGANTYSVSSANLTAGNLSKVDFTYNGTTISTYRYNDYKGCVWFPFVSQGVTSTLNGNTIPGNSTGRVNV